MPNNPEIVYELSYRRFAREWIHETIFDLILEKRWCYFPGRDEITGLPIGRNLSGFLELGWPEPAQGGQITHSFTLPEKPKGHSGWRRRR